MTIYNRLCGIGRSLTALVTPFREKQVDWQALARLAVRQVERGTAALVVCGSTGEAASLSLPEYARAVQTVVDAAGGRIPVTAGRTALATTATIATGAAAAAADPCHTRDTGAVAGGDESGDGRGGTRCAADGPCPGELTSEGAHD